MLINANNEYKIAIDIGTTTVEIAILDENGDIVATDYFKNPQSLYGKDVINRITAVNRDIMFLKIMKDMVSKAIKLSILTMLSDKQLSSDSIKAMCICGNTTMISIMLEYELKQLGEYPFKHRLNKSVTMDSIRLFGHDFPINCKVILTGCTSAFIGGDVLAGLLSVHKDFNLITDQCFLFMDLGTNGELVLYKNNKYYTTSTACGPAFESSSRCTNIYGNSIIDAITLGIKAGRISNAGILEDSLLETGIDIMGITITADLLRDILMAKAAIRTGIDILLEESGTNIEEIDYLFLAGGFGFYLNIDNAIYIGLIPEIIKNKIKHLGNTSLKGAIYILKHQDNIMFVDNYNKNDVCLIQASNLPEYQDKLLSNMYFKK